MGMVMMGSVFRYTRTFFYVTSYTKYSEAHIGASAPRIYLGCVYASFLCRHNVKEMLVVRRTGQDQQQGQADHIVQIRLAFIIAGRSGEAFLMTERWLTDE